MQIDSTARSYSTSSSIKTVTAAYQSGEKGNDYLCGDDSDNFILGMHGEDDLFGYDGDDSIYGGCSKADPDDDDDIIDGGAGCDYLLGNGGNDTIYGDDLYDSDQGGDEIYGGLGCDDIYGDGGNDTIYGGGALAHPQESADRICGGDGDDLIYGNGGSDAIFGGCGNDTMYGGVDYDYYYFEGKVGHDVVAQFTGAGKNGGDKLAFACGLSGNYSASDWLDDICYENGNAYIEMEDGSTITVWNIDGTLNESDIWVY